MSFRRIVLAATLFVAAGGMAVLAADTLAFSEMYVKGVLGNSFSPKAASLKGKAVQVVGFMAPPLRVEGRFFVLTKTPVSLCPFCNTDADWPVDILVVYLKKDEVFEQRNRPLFVTGRLELGSYTDAETGFVSQARLMDATYRDR